MKHIKVSLNVSLLIEQIFRQVFAKQTAFVKKKKDDVLSLSQKE